MATKTVNYKKITYWGAGVLVFATVVWSLIPHPVRVEIEKITEGRFEKTIVEDGTTRVKDRFVVSSPVDGVLGRVSWHAGDKVKKGDQLLTMKWDVNRQVRSPVDGEILRVLIKDEKHVMKGTPILEVGDPHALEIVVDVLTSSAVLINGGDLVRIENWGGSTPLKGKVVRIEPSAFTKVSALGVEEQRVNAIVSIISPPDEWGTLGDRFQVECHIVIDEWEKASLIPTGALFQKGKEWAAYLVKGGHARLTTLEIGERGPIQTILKSGLNTGDEVIVYPAAFIEDGSKVVGQK